MRCGRNRPGRARSSSRRTAPTDQPCRGSIRPRGFPLQHTGSRSMKPSRRMVLRAATHVAALLAAGVSLLMLPLQDARAQAPRTIRVIVPFPAGGPTDTLARLLADQIGQAQKADIDDREPAGGELGDRNRSGGARGPGRRHSARQLARIPDQPEPAEARLRSAEELRARVLPRVNSPTVVAVNGASPLSQPCRASRRRAEARPGALSLGQRRSGHHDADCLRDAQQARHAKVDMTFVPYPGMAPARHRAAGRACRCGVARLRAGRGADQSRQAAPPRQGHDDRRAAAGADCRRSRLSGHQCGPLVRGGRPGPDAGEHDR